MPLLCKSNYTWDSVAVSQFRVCVLRRPHLKANYVTAKAPPTAANKCGLLFPVFGRCTSHIPRFVAGLGSRNRDVRVKHLLTQPGSAPKARPSHLTTTDAVNKVSEGLAFKDRKGRDLRRMQTLNWDTASVCLVSKFKWPFSTRHLWLTMSKTIIMRSKLKLP